MLPTRAVFRPKRYHLLLLGLLLVTFYVVVPQLDTFHGGLKLLRHPALGPLAVAVVLTGLTYLAATGIYCLLAFQPLIYRRTLLVQLSSLFVNRVLPAGIGALSVNYIYLRRSKHTAAQAAAVVSANNLLGILGHVGLLGLAWGLAADHLAVPRLPLPAAHFWWVLMAVAALLCLALLGFSRWRQRLRRSVGLTVRQLAAYRRRPGHLGLALLTSMSLTLCTVGSLWFSLLALHVHLAVITVLVVFTLGLGVGTATPTPGGLGGLEAGLVVGLVAYHVPSATAVAGVLLYRLLNYWLGLIIGVVAFTVAQRRGLFQP